MKNIFFCKATYFIKHKIHNFDYLYFYAQALAYKEFLKLATLRKKHVQTVEPRSTLMPAGRCTIFLPSFQQVGAQYSYPRSSRYVYSILTFLPVGRCTVFLPSCLQVSGQYFYSPVYRQVCSISIFLPAGRYAVFLPSCQYIGVQYSYPPFSRYV